MARRFAGKYSNRPPEPQESARRAARQSKLLFLIPFLYAINAFRSPSQAMVLGLLACGLMLLAAWLTGKAARAQLADAADKIAQPAAIPHKLIAAVLMGVGLLLGGLMTQSDLALPVCYGMAGMALHMLAFEPAPAADKPPARQDTFDSARVAQAVSEGEAFLAAMQRAILRAGDAGLAARVDGFASLARDLFRQVENDPSDLSGARKFLTIYLRGARDATVKFVDTYDAAPDAKTRAAFEALLSDLETSFAARRRALLENDPLDLEVEISVLRERLALEK